MNNDSQFLADFTSMSQFGATPRGGVDRQAATITDGRLRSWFKGLLESRGFTVHYDHIGNQFGLLELVPGAPYIALGSHLDSQPLGGKYDGAYGVLAAAHAATRVSQTLSSEAKFNIAVVNWFNEEGSRFKPSMMGSSVFTGKLALQTALQATDSAGISVANALANIETVGNFELEVAAYLEIHIEQGKFLDQKNINIGLVESTWGAYKYELEILGEQAHTGATLIGDRQDALLGASSIIVAAREVALQFSDADAEIVTSCGELSVFPNSPVVVASKVDMLLDIRCSDADRLEKANDELQKRIAQAAEFANVKVNQRTGHSWAAQNYDKAGMALAAQVADELGYSHSVVRTLAGHDSTNMKDIVPTIMLFVPSVNGISHNELEYTKDEDMLRGLNLLTGILGKVVTGEYVKP